MRALVTLGATLILFSSVPVAGGAIAHDAAAQKGRVAAVAAGETELEALAPLALARDQLSPPLGDAAGVGNTDVVSDGGFDGALVDACELVTVVISFFSAFGCAASFGTGLGFAAATVPRGLLAVDSCFTLCAAICFVATFQGIEWSLHIAE